MKTTDWSRIDGPVLMTRIGGDPFLFESLYEAVKWIGLAHILRLSFGRLGSIDDFTPYDKRRLAGSGDAYVLLDCHGMIIPAWRLHAYALGLPGATWVTKTKSKHRRYHWNYDPATFRRSPVPGIYRSNFRGYHRRVHTTAEIRDNLYHELEHPGLVRRARLHLPTLWDDQPPSRRGDGWKNYRRRQYREKNNL